MSEFFPCIQVGGKRQKPMPSREELLSRNSFASVNENRHLDKLSRRRKMVNQWPARIVCVLILALAAAVEAGWVYL